jgi:hypothetical protein
VTLCFFVAGFRPKTNPSHLSSARKKRRRMQHAAAFILLQVADQSIVSDVVGFFGVDCLPSSLALSPGQAQAEALARENTTANRACDVFHV